MQIIHDIKYTDTILLAIPYLESNIVVKIMCTKKHKNKRIMLNISFVESAINTLSCNNHTSRGYIQCNCSRVRKRRA